MKDEKQVRQAAVKFLSRREYCPQEMVEKLVHKGAERHLAESVVDRLNASGLISEERFAREFIRVRARQGYGPIRIKYELIQRGVTEHLASDCLNELEFNWSAHAGRVIERKYLSSPVDSYNEWAKRANFLKYRGFTAEQINENLGRYRKDSQ